MDFLALAAQCGPSVHPLTTQAIVRVESGFKPLVIRNNSLRKTYSPANMAGAVGLVKRFHASGHELAIGLMQVTTPWLARYQIGPAELLDSCTNIRIGTAILADNYRRFIPSSTQPEEALAKALSAYWSGSSHNGGAYVNQVYLRAGSTVRVPVTAGVTDGLLGVSRGRKAAIPAPDAARKSLYFSADAGHRFPDH